MRHRIPKISICIPVYPDMENGDYFLTRCLNSIKLQTFKDYEIVITREGNAPYNTNMAMKQARGSIVKILHQDDYLAHKDSLKEIAKAFASYKTKWLVTGCNHDDGKEIGNIHMPEYSPAIAKGVNSIGAPSVLAMRRINSLLFDDTLVWTFDCELYLRLFDAYGPPTVLRDVHVTIGVGAHQATNHISDEQKFREMRMLAKQYKER